VPDELLPEDVDAEGKDSNERITENLLAYVDGLRDFDVYHQTVSVGSSNEDVYRVQIRLKQLGYLYPDPDGSFGDSTALALKYFQRKHGLEETGIADKATQEVLFSSTASKAEEYVFPYRIGVDISQQKVYIMGWTGQDYSELVGTMVCSTGLDSTPTPTGVYQGLGRTGGENNGEWYYFEKFNCYAKWAYRIVGDIMFHSVVYSSEKRLRQSTVNNLGKKASHGCIRLQVKDAKWIYDNCPVGTTVEIRK
jgi:peptidoglycan hydrolase-like protein with peptidoglycan-binding domain